MGVVLVAEIVSHRYSHRQDGLRIRPKDGLEVYHRVRQSCIESKAEWSVQSWERSKN